MSTKELAALLNGREYGNEITKAEAALAKENGLVVVIGASDDLCEFYGAIDDEAGCYDGGIIYLDEDGVAELDCDNASCKLREKHLASCKTIEAVWCNDESGFDWTYKTDIPHETFEIFEDGEKYCRGIVFEAAALRRDSL